jgi:serine/threonine protein kinase
LRKDPVLAIDLVYGEYLLHEGKDGNAIEDQLRNRFPELAETLHAQFELHRALADPESSDTDESLPNPFGRYEIKQQLGRGGMGTVYLAHDSQLNRLVALKVPLLNHDPKRERQFLREARAAAALQHPSICPIYDFGEIDGRFYITMAYLEGGSLATRLDRGPLPVGEAINLARTIADALGEAHRAGIVHRDLKPANILFDKGGRPFVADFGLARNLKVTGIESTSGQAIAGTPAYMSPEQINGQSEDPTTDVYALGVVLYEALTGKRPFDGPLGTVLGKIAMDEPRPPSQVHPQVDRRLDAICLKALAKSPVDRFANMGAFRSALDQTDKPQAKNNPNKSRPLTFSIAAAIVIVVGVLIWRPWQHRTTENSGSSTTAPQARSPADPIAAERLADAAWALNKALALDENCASALICRANANIKKKNYAPAIADLKIATKLTPDDPLPEIDLAWAMNELGEHDTALVHANRAIERKRDSAEAFNQRGWAYQSKKMLREALADYTSAIGFDAQFIMGYENRAEVYMELGEDELAAKDLKRVSELKGGSKN